MELVELLDKYVSHTFSFLKRVQNFIGRSSAWIKNREKEKRTLAYIAEKANDIRNRFNLVKKTKIKADKAKAFMKFAGNSMIPGRRSMLQAAEEKKLQMELEALMRRIRKGLKEMQLFLEAVEKLAVTSDAVSDQNQILQLSEVNLETVKTTIEVAQIICPLLLLFKRSNRPQGFFKAKLHNVEVIEAQLHQYIGLITIICGAFTECSVADLCLKKPTLFLKHDVTEDHMEDILIKIKTLDRNRKDKHFRMVFLFKGKHNTFMEKFSEKKERMLQFLDDLEPCAIKLDKMNKGARISGVVGSSVGVVGGGLTIAGLALAPFTAGLSLGLTIAGAATAGTSVANSVVTTVTEKRVSSKQRKKANESFKEFMKDVNDLQNYLKEVNNHHTENNDDDEALKFTGKGASAIKSIDTVIDGVSVIKLLKPEKAVKAAGSGKVLSRAAADIPELGQAALKGPLAIGKAVRGGFIALNALFIGVDAFIIASEGVSLSQGSETETSKWIRARAALWRSEVNSLQRIYDSLEKGQKHFDKKQVLQNPF